MLTIITHQCLFTFTLLLLLLSLVLLPKTVSRHTTGYTATHGDEQQEDENGGRDGCEVALPACLNGTLEISAVGGGFDHQSVRDATVSFVLDGDW